MDKLGELFQSRREALGLSLLQVQEATFIPLRQLVNIEAENYEELPPEVFLRGLLRTYAKHLGLDPHEVMEIYDESQGKARAAEAFQEPEVRTPGRAWLTSDFFLGVLIFIGLVAVGLWASSRYLAPETPGSASEAVSSQGQLAPTVIPVSASGITLTVRAEGRALLKLAQDGKPAFEGTLEAGQTRQLRADQAIGVQTANAGDTLVSLDGKAWFSLGERGATASWSWLRVEEGIAIARLDERQAP